MEKGHLGMRIRKAREMAGLTQPELAKVFNISREAVSLWEKGTNQPTGDKIARIAAETQVSVEWLLTGQGERAGSAPAMVSLPFGAERAKDLGLIPVMGIGAAGTDGLCEWNGDIIDRVPRPPFLIDAVGAYAIYVLGTSMIPRYNDGEMAFVHPGRPITPGCYVVVQFYEDEGGGTPKVWIKQFLSRATRNTSLHQYNPPKDLKIPTQKILAVHRIVGTGER
jgi:phage repressor protein C with HTH and peptisase S24 domain